VSAWADGFPGGVRDALGPRFNAAPHSPVLSRRAHRTGTDSVRYWNEIAINASGIDHTPGYWHPGGRGGTGPTGAGDGNPATVGDPTFSPLGAPASNLNGPNFTPPFPAYPSGHAGFGGALFQILRKFYSADSISFTFVSDEFNGVTLDNHGNVRPLIPRSFSSLSQAEEENDQSRIYLGIHWAFDKTDGIAQGRQVADYVFENAFVPLQRTTRRSR